MVDTIVPVIFNQSTWSFWKIIVTYFLVKCVGIFRNIDLSLSSVSLSNEILSWKSTLSFELMPFHWTCIFFKTIINHRLGLKQLILFVSQFRFKPRMSCRIHLLTLIIFEARQLSSRHFLIHHLKHNMFYSFIVHMYNNLV